MLIPHLNVYKLCRIHLWGVLSCLVEYTKLKRTENFPPERKSISPKNTKLGAVKFASYRDKIDQDKYLFLDSNKLLNTNGPKSVI